MKRILWIASPGIAVILIAMFTVDPLKAKQWSFIVNWVGPFWTIWIFRSFCVFYIVFSLVAVWKGWFRGDHKTRQNTPRD
ncbi:hypothetical protein [Ochrobactrum sp. SFR4]|uniref:hypothetical protein n=1 Tax=Ochrobactrum sp. SFR4 TaxID=2717368 RepID=UPI001C8C204E|nr:hypothetical protein [Ochrobactrum sp. SFR4]MBX8826249.1 hypothetical protein [Ochrobactrum sp. SFR4]